MNPPFFARGGKEAGLGLVACLCLLAPCWAKATDFDPLFYSNDDFGDVGLMQTPTARMRPDGELGFGVSTVRPYNQIGFFAQLLPWLESSFRYTDVTDRLYSTDPNFSGSQHYKDKSLDMKARLLREGEYWPSMAVGIQDIGGTGLFSSEYVVSSYHWYDLDFSFGLAWGRLGSAGNIHNPFTAISSHFGNNRYSTDSSTSTPGGAGLGRLFTGKDIGPFGGVEWKAPIKGVMLKLEYDGNDYQHEGLNNNQRQNSHLNVGLDYRGLSGVDLGVGYERGNTVMGRITIFTNFQSLRGVPKTADPAPAEVAQAPVSYVGAAPPASPPPKPSPPSPVADVAKPPPASSEAGSSAATAPAPQEISSEEKQAFVLRLERALKQQGFTLIGVDYDGFLKEVHVWLSQNRFRNPAKAAGRAARVLSATAPAEVTKFTLEFVDAGVANYRVEIPRADFEKAARGDEEFDTALSTIRLMGPGDGFGNAEYFNASRFPLFSWDMGPAVRQSVGGPNGFYFGQLYWKFAGGVSLTDRLNLSAAVGLNIINNFNDIKLQSNSQLPHVRSDIVEYLQQGANGIINLESDYIWSPWPDVYHRISLGIFEEMYGGAATELLIRPYGRSWALAFDINRVKQRGFDEMFDFLPYTVTTGHATIYYKPGYYNLLFKLSAGQYLARDRGATLDISREFDSGVRLGAFATKTNVSAAQFGEGSFDKGVYISVPLDLFFSRSTRREAGFTFRPLTRDGGQMVYDGPELYFVVKDGQPSDFSRGASELLK